MRKGHYLHGEEHGLWEGYHEDGILAWKEHCLYGKLHGASEWYREDGTLYSKNYFLRIK
jgi:antitoxin component YwqK of YwqJK toxin-antitoxin module